MERKSRRFAASAAVAALACAAFAVPLGPGEALLASVGETGLAADDYCEEGSVTNNGRWVAFYSPATNLGPANAGGIEQIFVKDLKSGDVVLASQDDAGTPGDGDSEFPTISLNGRTVLYYTGAANLASGSGSGDQVVATDLRTGITTEVSVAPNGDPGTGNCDLYDTRPLSGNGRWAVFQSSSSNLVPMDLNAKRDVFLADLRKGTLERISNGIAGEADGDSKFPSISPNGRWIVYVSAATNLVPMDTNGVPDVFLYDVKRKTTTLVSVSTAGVQGNLASNSFAPAVSNNGRLVAFNSRATNLDADSTDSNGFADVFLRDVRAGTTKRISLGFMGAQPDADCGSIGITPNGKSVFYWAYASNLVEATDTIPYDMIIRDVAAGTNRHMLEAITGGSVNGGTYGYFNGLSANARWFVVTSEATNATAMPANGDWNVYRVDLK